MRSLRPHREDALIAVCGLVGGLLQWWWGLQTVVPWGDRHPGAPTLLPLAAMCGAALLRRTAQPWALWLATAALAGDIAAGGLLATVLMFTDLVYAAALYGSPRLSRLVTPGSLVVTAGVTIAAVATWRTGESVLVGLLAGLVTVAPASTGLLVRNHRDTADAERLRAEQTALLAEVDRTQAVTAERARMARELHDIVAGNLSAIALHSTAALSLPAQDHEGGRQALEVIRDNSVRGLAEMRRLIGLLREAGDDTEPGPVPTLDGLPDLLERARRGAPEGFALSLSDERTAALPAPVELAAYRVVQEAVTNALKHGAPGPVAIAVEERPGTLHVRVRSATRGPDAGDDAGAVRAPGTGTGLIGMRERTDLLGGTLAAEPDGPHHWLVDAALPLETPGTPQTPEKP